MCQALCLVLRNTVTNRQAGVCLDETNSAQREAYFLKMNMEIELPITLGLIRGENSML